MVVPRSEWSIEEAVAASSKVEHKHQNINAIQNVHSSKKPFIFLNNYLIQWILARGSNLKSPVIFGMIIGGLVTGIALATILPMYIRDQSKQSIDLTETEKTATFLYYFWC
jgi:hypothetical protein